MWQGMSSYCKCNSSQITTDGITPQSGLYMAEVIPQSLQPQLQIKKKQALADVRSQESAQSYIGIYKYVPAIGVVEVSVFICLNRSCHHMNEVGGL